VIESFPNVSSEMENASISFGNKLTTSTIFQENCRMIDQKRSKNPSFVVIKLNFFTKLR
jgi:hypothetical protein